MWMCYKSYFFNVSIFLKENVCNMLSGLRYTFGKSWFMVKALYAL